MFLALAFCTTAHAQGCTACRDTTAGSAPRTQQGLRRAIFVLGIPAAAFFIAVVGIAYNIERRREP